MEIFDSLNRFLDLKSEPMVGAEDDLCARAAALIDSLDEFEAGAINLRSLRRQLRQFALDTRAAADEKIANVDRLRLQLDAIDEHVELLDDGVFQQDREASLAAIAELADALLEASILLRAQARSKSAGLPELSNRWPKTPVLEPSCARPVQTTTNSPESPAATSGKSWNPVV